MVQVMKSEFLSIKQVAERQKLSRAWVHRLAASGQIPGAEKVGATWIVPAEWTCERQRRSRSGQAEKILA